MKKILLSAGAGLLALVVVSGVEASAGHDQHTAAAPMGQAGKASEVTRTIEVSMHDNYFEPENLSVSDGETVRFEITNQGGLVHEFNIGTAAMHEGHQADMLMMVQHGVLKGDKLDRSMMEMDMGNGQTMKHDDPNSVLLEPGEQGEIIWTFAKTANLQFACNVPGHYQAGMQGEISVQ
ncbi:MAG TPA: copper-binding protein [Pseudomonas sabulinigri]|uniref:EfeO-type cupredoxin-like domain-containing protein n=1 Tax=marine sediment metagenome TaxID=412755 RepID=A0A0F9T7I4_9ZZZZ|nr:copper-binding protein [Halopseudomonas sabulinigri]HEC52468.1 copper-binding protein [Halopseudomonas sabulinigri]